MAAQLVAAKSGAGFNNLVAVQADACRVDADVNAGQLRLRSDPYQNASCGIAQIGAGAKVTIQSTIVTPNSRVFVTRIAPADPPVAGVALGVLSVFVPPAGSGSFKVFECDPTDGQPLAGSDSQFFWMIVNRN